MMFTHLHVHDQYSFLDGYGSAKQYCERAKELGMKAIALTNHGNIDGAIKWQIACKEVGIKSILGVEAYIVPDLMVKEKGEKRGHITLLAKNEKGWENISKMLTYANIDGFYYKPRIDPELLLDHLDGVLVMSACYASFIYMDGGIDLLEELIAKRVDIALEIMPHDIEGQSEHNKLIVALADKYELPLVATNDCHYVTAEQADEQEVLLAMQSKKKWKDENRWRFDTQTLFLTSAEEMKGLFKKQKALPAKVVNEAIANTNMIADKCNLFIEKKDVLLPKPDVPGYEDIDENGQLIQLTLDGFEERMKKHDWIDKNNRQEYLDRISEELEIIIAQGFARYFLIVWELINWCKNPDDGGEPVMVGPGRGSVGGSIVAFCLHIIQVDAIKLNLVFSRFISEGRIDLPDIDMDFEDIKRDRILEHLKKTYGKHNVAGLSTFAKMHGRGALRDVARVFDVPLAEVDKAAKSIVVRCLDKDTKVWTNKGPIAIKLLDKNTNSTKVTAAYGSRRITKNIKAIHKTDRFVNMYEIVLESGKKIKCSIDHYFWTRNVRSGKIGWKTLKNTDQRTDTILAAEFDEVYSFCKQCGKLVYQHRTVKTHKRIFCSLSCTTTWRNIHNNPLDDPKALKKMKESRKGVRCKWFDDEKVVARVLAGRRKRMLENNPMKRPEVRAKASKKLKKIMKVVNNNPAKKEAQRQYMLKRLADNPESHPLRLLAKNPRKGVSVISKPQSELSILVKKVFVGYSVEDEYPIQRVINGKFKKIGHYYLDIAIPELMLNIEYDGGLHLLNKNINGDKERDKFLTNQGWKTIRFNKSNIKKAKKDLDEIRKNYIN